MAKIHTPVRQNLANDLIVIKRGAADYQQTHAAMLDRTLKRIDQKKQGHVTPDELWLIEHDDVYTLGQAGRREHILSVTDTPIIKTDRGGQVTWHGRGQLVAYWLFDLDRLGWGVRQMVSHAEQCIEDVLDAHLKDQLSAHARQDAPGVYIYDKAYDACHPTRHMLGKVASLGFKIKHGFSYHGFALNIRCDLSAFAAINPCGHHGMTMLNMCDVTKLNTVSPNESLLELPVVNAVIDNVIQRRQGSLTLR